MDWKKIKLEAKEKCAGKLWDIWKPTIIIYIISLIITVLATKIFGDNSNYTQLVSTLFSLLLVPAEVGYISYILKLVRDEDYDLSELKVFYNYIGTIIFLYILMAVLILLGCVAFIIPGIILMLAYSMAFYIFADNQDLNIDEYLTRSRKMMEGYKLNYLAFNLSFIGWILLCLLVIPMIWVIPYIATAQALYYDELKKTNSEEI
jgi:uncharacterized membrane protein